MTTPDLNFPVYRKYRNNSSYFKVLSTATFVELKKQPGGFFKHTFEAKILPDRNYIHDMLYNYHAHWEEISQEEYSEIESMLAGQ